jgi:MOSC domain-containing protein YiiM
VPGRVFQVSVSNGGVPKRAVREAFVGASGLEGDAVDHPKIHGGPERAVCLFSLEKLLALQAEGHPVFPGAVGENLTLAGVDWDGLREGAEVAVGAAVRLRLTRPVTPCSTIAPYFLGEKGYRRLDPERHPGWSRWYARVLREGPVRTGDSVRVEDGG